MRNLSRYSYSWDFEENGVTNTVSELKSIGINTVTLASTYHAGKFLRHKSKKSKIYFPEYGTAYFKSHVSRYGSMVHNAIGDSYIYALCRSAPEGRAYATGLTKDITENYEINGIWIESIGFPPYEQGLHHEMRLVRPNKWLASYLGLCFSTHCVKGAERAGVNQSCFYEQLTERIKADLTDIKRRIGGVGKIKGILRSVFPDLVNENAVVKAVQALYTDGVKDIGFYSYGHIRKQSLKRIESALGAVIK
jgi:hypothetical protein